RTCPATSRGGRTSWSGSSWTSSTATWRASRCATSWTSGGGTPPGTEPRTAGRHEERGCTDDDRIGTGQRRSRPRPGRARLARRDARHRAARPVRLGRALPGRGGGVGTGPDRTGERGAERVLQGVGGRGAGRGEGLGRAVGAGGAGG